MSGYIGKGKMHPSLYKAAAALKKGGLKVEPDTKKTTKGGLNKVEKKQVKKLIAKNGELKYSPSLVWDSYATQDGTLTNDEDRVPVPIPNTNTNSGSLTSAYIVCLETGLALGEEMTDLNAAITPAGASQQAIAPIYMYNMAALNDPGAQGLDPGVLREGEYLYAHSQRVRLLVQMKQAATMDINNYPNNQPMTFRCIVVKRKPGRVIAGDPGVDFRTELFRDYNNNIKGLLSTKTNMQLDQWSVNRQALEVLKDFKFRLSQPICPTGAAAPFPTTPGSAITSNQSNSFQSTKLIDFYLPKPKHKIKWSGTSNSDPRDSFNYKVEIFIMAYYNNSPNRAAGLIADEWTCKVYTESKFREP